MYNHSFMIENGESHPPHPPKQKPLVLVAVALLIAVIAGTGGYVLGRSSGQKSEFISQTAPIVSTKLTGTDAITPTVSPTVAVMQTAIPTLTANWKTYTNAKWGITLKYPEEWFSQQVPESSQVGDAIAFYPYGVTPFNGAGDEGTNAVLIVSDNEGQSQQ